MKGKCTVNVHPDRKTGPFHRPCGEPAIALSGSKLLCMTHAKERLRQLDRWRRDLSNKIIDNTHDAVRIVDGPSAGEVRHG